MKSYKFWQWLRSYANKKVRQHYMAQYHHDRKCPNCRTWTSEIDGCAQLDISDCGMLDFMECKQCGEFSTWDCSGMLPTLAADRVGGAAK